MARAKGSKKSAGASSERSSHSKQSAQPRAEEQSTLETARDFVQTNATLQTAGVALAGAGLLALVATPAGRNIIRVTTDAVMNLISSRMGGVETSDSQTASSQESTPASGKSQKQRRDQARA